jgi:hypothetical protein
LLVEISIQFRHEGTAVNNEPQDSYVVFLRTGSGSAWRPEDVEQAIAACATYGEAVKVRQKYRRPGTTCIIRCTGETGGGD